MSFRGPQGPNRLVGRTLGHYRIIEQIGAGGMGVVYRARDEQLERDVAIKVLPTGTLADEAARKRFRKEAVALARLNHPNIATIHDFDRQQGVDFLVTEYIPGMMLGDKIAGRPMPEKEITQLGTQLAEGLAAAHEEGVVHRDLKPDNLRLTRNGWLKILDFGLAKLVQPFSPQITTESLTETPVVAGTLPYMSPEQLRGEKADAHTDIYALGVVLYEMATGQRPFRAKQVTRLLDQILHESPQTPRALNPRVSPDLERIIVKCLEKDPENRYHSAREVVVDLRRLSNPDTAYVKELVSRPIRITVLVATGILVALSSVAGFWAWRHYSSHGLPQTERIMLAVLPFENRGGDPSQDFFADGLTEEMIAQLGRVSPRQLGVIARTSAMHYKNTGKSVAQIGHELRVDYVLEGGTRQMGNQVRITAELIHVSDQAQLWSSSYARKVEDILELQNAVALSIAQALAVELLPGVQESFRNVRSVNPQAHDAYLYGRFHWSRLTAPELRKARLYFDQAVRIDPNYPQAYVGLADYYGVTYELPSRVAMAKAREHVQKALALDNALPEAHRALAWIEYSDWKWPEAEQHFKLAVKLNPSYAEAHQAYSIFLSTLGRTSEAWEEIHTAQQLDPFSVPINTTAGWIDYFARRYDEAIEQCKKAQDFEPSAANPHDCLGSAYLAKGMFQDAIHECQMAMTLSGKDPDRAVCLGRAYAAVGDWRQSRKVLQDLQAETGQKHIPPYFVGVLYAALGENDQAFASLEKSYHEHDPYLAWIKVSPAVDTLRTDPRLKDLVRRLSFSE